MAMLASLQAQGFDLSKRNGKSYSIGCSQCAALVINGTPCHETGCPNVRDECCGCSNDVPRGVRYCEDCQ